MDTILLQDIQLAPNALAALSATAAALFLLPIIFAAFWKKRCGKAVSFKPLLIGAAGFLITVRVLELGVHMVCIVLDNPISRFINGSTAAFVLYGALMAGIFEECGRYVILKYFMKKGKTRENMVMYGIGHGGIEVWAVTLVSVASLLALAFLLQSQGVEGALQFMGIQEDASGSLMAAAAATLASVANFSAASGGLMVLERFLCMFLHISLTVVVAYGVAERERVYLPLAVLAHALVDVLPALYQRGAVTVWITELWLCACTALLTVWSRKLYKAMGNRPAPIEIDKNQ